MHLFISAPLDTLAADGVNAQQITLTQMCHKTVAHASHHPARLPLDPDKRKLKIMSRQKMIRGSATIFGSMLLLTVLHSFASAQLDLPYAVRSLLAISGGSTLGLVASLIWLNWLRRTGYLFDR